VEGLVMIYQGAWRFNQVITTAATLVIESPEHLSGVSAMVCQ